MKTKEKILQEALRLFSTKGYAATGVEEIAAAVGIKAASLYKHYRNKRAIFDAIFEETGKRYNDFTNSISVYNDDRSKNELENLRSITADELVLKVKKLVQYSLNDEYVANFRKMMTVEQYSNQEFSELYQQRFVEMMFKYHEELFKKLIKLGMIQDEDPKTQAEIYGSPIYVHIGNCDRKTETEQECLKALEKHVRLFQRENNMSKAIVYTSNTGYTKEYAEMLILEFKQPLYELNNARKNLNIGDKVVYLGWVMADMVQGYKEAGEYFCINLLCAVGLSLNGTKIDKIKEANQIDDFTPLFTLQGGLDLKKLKGVKKLIMKMISKSMLRELLNKNDISDDDRKLISILQDGESGVSTNNLRDAVKYYYENCI